MNIYYLIIISPHKYLNGNPSIIQGKGGKKQKGAKKVVRTNPLFQSKPRNFRVGNDIQPKRNLTRFVRWPKYITFQRQKRILLTRIKIPPVIAQFSRALDKNQTNVLFKLLKKYSPEDKKERRARLVEAAKLKAESILSVYLEKNVDNQKPYHIKFGINHVTKLIEERKAKLVVIASNVDPIELVIWLPALCRKMDIPYCFVQGKAKLGQLVHQKNATAVCLTDVRKEDEGDLTNLANAFRTNFNNNVEMRKQIGGFQRGNKSQIKYNRVQQQREKEAIQKLQ